MCQFWTNFFLAESVEVDFFSDLLGVWRYDLYIREALGLLAETKRRTEMTATIRTFGKLNPSNATRKSPVAINADDNLSWDDTPTKYESSEMQARQIAKWRKLVK